MLKNLNPNKKTGLILFFSKLSQFKNIYNFVLLSVPLFIISYMLNMNLAIPILLLSLIVYFKILYDPFRFRTFTTLNLIFLFVLFFGMSFFIIDTGGPVLFVPFCVITMLSTILFEDLVISMLLTVACSLTLASFAGGHFRVGILFLITGLLSNILVYGVRRRITVIRAGFIIGIVQTSLLFIINNFSVINPLNYIFFLFNGIACGVIVLGILPIFEYLFKTITNISLLELADFNHPLLNRVMLEAPGTYHHCLIVGNLADAACRAIGANSLLARIGAYYHDIGKLQKPEYFSENQGMQVSKHDNLAPNISKLIIMNHVKEGVELAKKYKLNPVLIDFIQQHHGTSLVYYFYRRALESVEENQEITEEGFRYPGPKPNTKEKAIVLLADAVEATARTIKETSHGKIEEVVHKIVNNKFIDGQLDECDLTLKDLEKISSVFVRVLSGIYHVRVDYPEEKNGQTG